MYGRGPAALSPEDRDAASRVLGRDPGELEAALLATAWSERCSARSVRPLLATLPGLSLAGITGARHAGVVPTGNGPPLAVSLASGTGPGLLDSPEAAGRLVADALSELAALGARPLGLVDAVTVDPETEGAAPARLAAVLRKVAARGAAVGAPLVGGQVALRRGAADALRVIGIGVADEARESGLRAPAPGDILLLLTADAGAGPAPLLAVGRALAGRRLVAVLWRPGPGGIACAAADATWEAAQTRAPRAAAGSLGIALDLDALRTVTDPDAGIPDAHARDIEVLTAARPPSMLAIVSIAAEAATISACAGSGVRPTRIGRVTADGMLTVAVRTAAEQVAAEQIAAAPPAAGSLFAEQIAAAIPLAAFVGDSVPVQRRADPPRRRRQAPAPGAPDWASDRLPIRGMDPGAVLRGLLGSPELCSRCRIGPRPGDTATYPRHAAGPGLGIASPTPARDPAVPGIACATDGAHGVGLLDPRRGAALAVASASRAMSAAGAQPAGLGVVIEAGAPADPEAFWQLTEAVRGIAEASRGLGLAVAAARVVLDEVGPARRAAPSTQVAAVGVAGAGGRGAPGFRADGDRVALLGAAVPGLAGSVYAALAGSAVEERLPSFDVAAELALQRVLLEAAADDLFVSARSVDAGGLAVALALSAIEGGLGARLSLEVSAEPAVELFGESPARAVVTVRLRDRDRLAALVSRHGVPLGWLGSVGGDRLHVDLVGGGAAGAAEERGASVADAVDCGVEELRRAWEQALGRAGRAADAVPERAAATPGPDGVA